MFKNWGKDIEPPEFTTKEEVQEMIDAAIRKHNRNASIISMCVGWVVLALFAEGLLRLIGVIDPIFPCSRSHFRMDRHSPRVDFWGNYVLPRSFIFHQKHGYSRKETEDPEARDRTRRQIEKILRDLKEDSTTL